jgi:hypothetical protein
VTQTFFNENPESDKLGKLRQDIGGVRDVMVSNIGTGHRRPLPLRGGVGGGCVWACVSRVAARVLRLVGPVGRLPWRGAPAVCAVLTPALCAAEKILERGEKIELLVDKTDALNQSAARFQKQVWAPAFPERPCSSRPQPLRPMLHLPCCAVCGVVCFAGPDHCTCQGLLRISVHVRAASLPHAQHGQCPCWFRLVYCACGLCVCVRVCPCRVPLP